jgi:DNA repair protein RadC
MEGNLRIRNLSLGDKPRERLISYGAPALSDRELLAVILRSGGASGSALSLAGNILSRFGGFRGLLSSDITQLLSFEDVGVAKATSIKALCEISLRMQALDANKKVEIRCPLDIFNLLKKDFYAKEKEYLYVVSLNSKRQLISRDLMSIGTISETLVHPREIFMQALVKNAVSIVLAHNHPSGDPNPSFQDISMTRRVAKAGVVLGIPLIDHVVVSDERFVSMKSGNYLTASVLKGGEK